MPNQMPNTDSWKSHWILLIIVALIGIAALPRLYGLGDIGFQKDEEYTAWTAKSLLEEGSLALPSGMEYRRALPLTAATALSIGLFGSDSEAAYRFPATLIGIITPAIFFLLLRPILGVTTAAVTALLLGLSEWHILLSREARMYAPFLLFYFSAGIFLWQWASTGSRRHLLIGGLLFIAAASLQKLALLALIFPLAPLVIRKESAVPVWKVALFIMVAGAAVMLYSKLFIAPPYNEIKATGLGANGKHSSFFTTPLALLFTHFNSFLYLYLLLIPGTAVGYWLARSRFESSAFEGNQLRKAAYYLLALLSGILCFAGQLYAAVLTIFFFFLITPELPTIFSKRSRGPLIVLAITAIGWLVLGIWLHGIHDGFKHASIFPFPYIAYFAFISPGVLAIFLVSCVMIIIKPSAFSYAQRSFIVYALLPVLMIGAVSQWGGARYIISAYPFLIAVAAVGLVSMVRTLGEKTGLLNAPGVLIVALTLSMSGLLPGSGAPAAVRAASMGYGEPDYWSALVFPTNPDHKGAGEFVRSQLEEGDIVIAEDVSVQLWYAGQADYWLRSFSDAKIYLYQDENGAIRDIYVGSIWLSHDLAEEVLTTGDRRIWIITSAQAGGDKARFLDREQRAWLKSIDSKSPPLYTGRDNNTKVYCLGCQP